MSIDKYATAISRSYWITLGLCATAFIVSTGYDEAGRYKEAIAELTALPNIVTGPKVYRELKERTRETIAVPLANSLVKAAGGNFRTDVNMLLANMDYALVDDGPQAFNFRSSPSEAIRLADEVLSNKVYTLRIPKRGYDSPELSLALREGSQKIFGPPDDPAPKIFVPKIIGVDFACNWANDQCNASIAIEPIKAGQAVRRIELFIPSERYETSVRPYQVLGYSDVANAREALALRRLRELEREGLLAGLSYDQAIAQLNKAMAEKQTNLKMFDLSFSGTSVFYALPIAIALSLFWLLLNVRELLDICFEMLPKQSPSDELRKQAIEILYESKWAARVIPGAILFAPAGAILLLMTSVPSGSGPVLMPWLLFSLGASWVISLLVLRERRRVKFHFGKPSRPAVPM